MVVIQNLRGRMKAFLKENLVLVAGISLPVILALVFMASTAVYKSGIEPPQYKLIFATDYRKRSNEYEYPYRFIVKGNKIFLNVTPPEKGKWPRLMPSLYIFDPATKTSNKIRIPKIPDHTKATKIEISSLPKGQYFTLQQSPDGYAFEKSYRREFNLMSEVFGGGYRSRSRYSLRKKGYKIHVPHAKSYNTELIAWVKNNG